MRLLNNSLMMIILMLSCVGQQVNGKSYSPTENLGDINCKAIDFQDQLESLHMSTVDAWILMIGSSIALVIQMIFIVLSIMVPRMRAQPGDLLFGAFCAETLLSIHWLSHGVERIINPNSTLACEDTFCFVNSLVSLAGGMMSALYNIMFFFFIGASIKDSLAVKGISSKSTHLTAFILTAIGLSLLFAFGLNGKTLYGTCSFAADESMPMISFILYIFCLPFAIIAIMYFNKKIPNTQFYKKQRREFLRFSQSYLTSTIILYGGIAICNSALFLNCSYFHQDYFLYFRSIGTICKIIATITLPLLRMQDPYVRAIFNEQGILIAKKLHLERKTQHTPQLEKEDFQTEISETSAKNTLKLRLNQNEHSIDISPNKLLLKKIKNQKLSALDDSINLFSRFNSGGSVLFDGRNKSNLFFNLRQQKQQELLTPIEIEQRISAFSGNKQSRDSSGPNKGQTLSSDLQKPQDISITSSIDCEFSTRKDDIQLSSVQNNSHSLIKSLRNEKEKTSLNYEESRDSQIKNKMTSSNLSQNPKRVSFSSLSQHVANEEIKMKKISLFNRQVQNPTRSTSKRPSQLLQSETSKIKLQQRLLNLFKNNQEEDSVSVQEQIIKSNNLTDEKIEIKEEQMWKNVIKWSDAFGEEEEQEQLKEKVKDMLRNAQVADLFNDPFYRMDSGSTRSSSGGGKHLDSIFGCDSFLSDGQAAISDSQLKAEDIVDAKEHFVRTLQRNLKMGVLCRIICGILLHNIRKTNFCTKFELSVEGKLPSNKGKNLNLLAPRPSKADVLIQLYGRNSSVSSRYTIQENDEVADSSEIPTYNEQPISQRNTNIQLVNQKVDFIRSSNGTISLQPNQYFTQKVEEDEDVYGFEEETSWIFKEAKTYQYNDDSIKSNLKNSPTQLLESDPFDLIRMKIYAPLVFHSLLRQESSNAKIEDSFNLQNNLAQIKNASGSDGGKSGQFFFFSYDNKFLLKTITPEELKILINTIQPYFKHLKKHSQSLIAKIFGIFTFEGLNEKPINLILMKNLAACKRQFIERTYDIKGSTYDRQVLSKQNQHSSKALNKIIMKDTDFIEIEKVLKINKEERIKIFIQLEEDSKFLASQGLIDYSLIVFKVRKYPSISKESLSTQPVYLEEDEDGDVGENEYYQFECTEEKGIYYHIGIIDYLQLFTFQKKMEKYAKKLINLNLSLDTSSQDPLTYSKRFISFMKQILDI